MAKKRNPRIDEELVRQMIGGRAPLTDNVVMEDTSAPDYNPDTSPASDASPEPRRRRAALLNFEKTFMARQDIRYRSALYVGVETKRKILEVVKKIGGERMTVTSYVENILCHHLELYKDEINCIHKEQNSKNII
ncbi:MAG: DUF3408 domain-containing protein [Bacteroides cellulosilyticus]|nr:DUF3408 domain-containing protein [Bacteroides cellulosilyticus]